MIEMLKRILLILCTNFLLGPSQARAESWYAGVQGTVPAFGVHLGWEDQGYGVRFSVSGAPISSVLLGASLDAYILTESEKARAYLGGGVSVLYEGAGQTTYGVLEGLAGFGFELGGGTRLYLEWNPGLILLRNPSYAASTPVEYQYEYFPIVEILFVTRINLGLSFRL
jgi:hypothetical protein